MGCRVDVYIDCTRHTCSRVTHQPANPCKPVPAQPVNLYPWSWVRVSAGKGTGRCWATWGLPVPITSHGSTFFVIKSSVQAHPSIWCMLNGSHHFRGLYTKPRVTQGVQVLSRHNTWILPGFQVFYRVKVLAVNPSQTRPGVHLESIWDSRYSPWTLPGIPRTPGTVPCVTCF